MVSRYDKTIFVQERNGKMGLKRVALRTGVQFASTGRPAALCVDGSYGVGVARSGMSAAVLAISFCSQFHPD